MSSENVNYVFYDETNNLLTVEYRGGSVVVYQPVNPENYAEVIKSNCLSKAVHKITRQPNVVGITQQRGH
jgi:hypothetical protein